MILSASRRTDIPAYYSDWFFNRLREGYALVRNPMNPRHVSRIPLLPNVVDGIVFWTKNPQPMLPRLHELREYTFYFQVTLTSYRSDIEPGVPSKNAVVLPAFRKMAEQLGPERLVWRYDPILLNEAYTADYHLLYFEKLAARLEGCTEKCTVSFLDCYRSIEPAIRALGIRQPDSGERIELLAKLAEIAARHGMFMDTCAEPRELAAAGVGQACCIDRERLERIGGFRLSVSKDTAQRPECGCAASVDIGAYNTCLNGCRYCYANHSQTLVSRNHATYDPASPLLCGTLNEQDTITDRNVKSYRVFQLGF